VQKVGQAAAAGTAGSYLQGHFAYPAAAQGGMVAAAPNGMMPVYPFYHYQYHHATQGLGVVPAAHFFPTVSAAAVTTVPAIVSKPTVMAAAPKGKLIDHSTQIYPSPPYIATPRRMCSRRGITRAELRASHVLARCHGISGRAKLAWQVHANKH
jgi:hypothetical protein